MPQADTQIKPKFTPGPLQVSRASMPIDGEYDYAISAIIDGRPVVIAECFGRVSETGTPDAASNAALYAAAPDLLAALRALVNAKALSGVRNLVAGWNGENRPEGPHKERHPTYLGARIETNCGSVYELDELMQAALVALAKASTVQS